MSDMKRLLEKMTQFAGQAVGQKPGDQVRGTEKATKRKDNKHPFAGRLVGASESKSLLADLEKELVEGAVKRSLAEQFAEFKETKVAYDKQTGQMGVDNSDPDQRHGLYINGKLVKTVNGADAANNLKKRDPRFKDATVKKIAESDDMFADRQSQKIGQAIIKAGKSVIEDAPHMWPDDKEMIEFTIIDGKDMIKIGKTFIEQGMSAGEDAFWDVDTAVRDQMYDAVLDIGIDLNDVLLDEQQDVAEGSNVDSQIKRIKDRILQLKDWNTAGTHDKKIKELQARLKELQSQKQGVAEGAAVFDPMKGIHALFALERQYKSGNIGTYDELMKKLGDHVQWTNVVGHNLKQQVPGFTVNDFWTLDNIVRDLSDGYGLPEWFRIINDGGWEDLIEKYKQYMTQRHGQTMNEQGVAEESDDDTVFASGKPTVYQTKNGFYAWVLGGNVLSYSLAHGGTDTGRKSNDPVLQEYLSKYAKPVKFNDLHEHHKRILLQQLADMQSSSVVAEEMTPAGEFLNKQERLKAGDKVYYKGRVVGIATGDMDDDRVVFKPVPGYGTNPNFASLPIDLISLRESNQFSDLEIAIMEGGNSLEELDESRLIHSDSKVNIFYKPGHNQTKAQMVARMVPNSQVDRIIASLVNKFGVKSTDFEWHPGDRDQYKFTNEDAESFGYKSLHPEIFKARQQFPMAKSDMEALLMYVQSQEKQDIDRVDRVNDREDAEINQLDKEEDSLERRIDALTAQLEKLKTKAKTVKEEVPAPVATAGGPAGANQPKTTPPGATPAVDPAQQALQKQNQAKLQQNLANLKSAGVQIDPAKAAQTLQKTDTGAPMNAMDKDTIAQMAPAIGNVMANPQTATQLNTLIKKAGGGV